MRRTSNLAEVFESTVTANALVWAEYWEASSITLSRPDLESIWYRNLYFARCAIRPDGPCPGLFGPRMYRDIGSARHGDYHFNYNIQLLRDAWGWRFRILPTRLNRNFRHT